MNNKSRIVTGTSDLDGAVLNTAFRSAATSIAFNFEGVGLSYKGKTAAVRIKKIRYTNFLWSETSDMTAYFDAWIQHVTNFLTGVRDKFTITGIRDYQERIWGDNKTFAISDTGSNPKGFVQAGSIFTIGNSDGLVLGTKELEVDLLWPFQELYSCGYWCSYMIGLIASATGSMSLRHNAEIEYDYEYLGPAEFQALKNNCMRYVRNVEPNAVLQ